LESNVKICEISSKSSDNLIGNVKYYSKILVKENKKVDRELEILILWILFEQVVHLNKFFKIDEIKSWEAVLMDC
jgi:hypothetical protein